MHTSRHDTTASLLISALIKTKSDTTCWIPSERHQTAKPLHHKPYLHLDVEDGAELVDVGLAAGAAEDALAGEGMELGNIPTEDLVTAGQPGIGCDDGVVRAGDGQGGAAVEIVRREPALVWRLSHTVIDPTVGIWLTTMGVRSRVECDGYATACSTKKQHGRECKMNKGRQMG